MSMDPLVAYIGKPVPRTGSFHLLIFQVCPPGTISEHLQERGEDRKLYRQAFNLALVDHFFLFYSHSSLNVFFFPVILCQFYIVLYLDFIQ